MTELPLAAASRNVTTAPAFMPNASRPTFRPTPKPAPAYTKSNTAMGHSGRDAANVRAIPVNLLVRPDAGPYPMEVAYGKFWLFPLLTAVALPSSDPDCK